MQNDSPWVPPEPRQFWTSEPGKHRLPDQHAPLCAQYRSEVSTTQSPQGYRNTAEGLQPRRPEGLLLYLVHMCRLRAIVRPGGNTAPVTQAPAAMQLDAFNAAGTERTARWEGGEGSEEIKTAETPQIVSPGCGAGSDCTRPTAVNPRGCPFSIPRLWHSAALHWPDTCESDQRPPRPRGRRDLR